MLVLTRKSEEKITIGKEDQQIVITVLKIKGKGEQPSVSLGIEAPPDYKIWRNELIDDDNYADAENTRDLSIEESKNIAAPVA